MSQQTPSFFTKYLSLDGMTPLKIGLISGIYPFLFYVSNNYYAVNSLEHFAFFAVFFIGIPVVLFFLMAILVRSIPMLHRYEKQLIFIAIVFVVALFTSYASTLLIKKKLLLGVLVVAGLVSIKLADRYKKLIPLIILASLLPFAKLVYKIYEGEGKITWLQQPDGIEEATFISTPNVYMIQPDGYVGRSMMEGALYNNKSDIYDWLEAESFTIYDGFRSNYPASLNSNASLFAMRQHKFGSKLMPAFEMPFAREVISGDNPVVRVFKKNNYETFFIAQDEYFQQNFAPQLYDHFNVDIKDVAYFSKGETVTREVLPDVKAAFKIARKDTPNFFFIEKCLPHHVHFAAPGDRIQEERNEYLENVEEVNGWLKETIDFITSQDPDGIIIVLADHGGWVGLENYGKMFSTKDPIHINSIYSTLAAIKWNGFKKGQEDADLKTNVNMFRVLFSVLSGDKSFLEHMEDDASYNLHNESSLFYGVVKVITAKGDVVYEKQ